VTVTVLFTDLVDSTALLSRVGENRAEVLRREHFALLRAAVVGQNGREVKNLGDGLMVVFDGVTAALSSAIDMQQRLEVRNRSAEEGLSIRVGVSHGEADREDDDYFGLPVVEASRLCGRAAGGEILTTEIVRLLAGSRGDLQFDSLGGLELKGIDEPVSAFRVAWTPFRARDAFEVPLPSRVSGATVDSFVGRETERARLVDAAKAAEAGGRRLVLLSGEAGIGKTSLTAALAQRAFADGSVVLYGRCDEDLGIPYQPWAEALQHLVAHVDDEVLVEHVRRQGGRLAHLVPALCTRVPDMPADSSSDADAARYLLFGDVVELLAGVGQAGLVVVILDDLHWADKPTTQLLRHVVASTVPLRLLIVATFRESELSAHHPLSETLAALHREQGVERCALAGLDDNDLLALMESMAGHEMNDDGIALRDALMRETDGNPFFVSEILRHLADTGAIRQGDDGRWSAAVDIASMGLPVSIREVVGQRVARLGPEAVSVLSTAAVIGRDFDLPLLAAATTYTADQVLDVLDAAIEAGVLIESAGRSGGYSFAHALIEHTLYRDLTTNRRTRLHRVIAEKLEELAGAAPESRLGELAWHWSEAVVAVDIDKAVLYAQRAGEHALEQLAPDEALRWFRRALELLTLEAAQVNTERRCEILVGLGEAQRQVGESAYRDSLLEAAHIAHRNGFSQLLVRSALANNRGIFSVAGQVDEPRLEMLRAALNVSPPEQHATRAKLLALTAVESMFGAPLAERRSIVESAVDAARASGDPATLAEVLARTHVTVEVPETLDDRLNATTEARALAAGLDDPFLQWLTHMVSVGAALDLGDMEARDRYLAKTRSAAARLGHPHPLWETRFQESHAAMIAGDGADAERLANEALAFALETGEPDAFTIFGVQLVGIRWLQGRLDELLPSLREAVAEQPLIPGFRAALAFALARSDERAEARELLDQARHVDFDLPHDLTWLGGLAMWADTAARLNDVDSACVLFDRLAPWPTQNVNPNVTSFGTVAHYLGELAAVRGDAVNSERYLLQALDLHRRMRAPFFVANTQLELAALYSRDTDTDRIARSRRLVKEILATARDRGYAGLERAALDLQTN
jgi:class 3 adenylate cyclase